MFLSGFLASSPIPALTNELPKPPAHDVARFDVLPDAMPLVVQHAPEIPYLAVVVHYGGLPTAETFEAWRRDFVNVASMRGVGWAILYQDPESGRLSNHWITLHEHGHPVGFRPLLVRHRDLPAARLEGVDLDQDRHEKRDEQQYGKKAPGAEGGRVPRLPG